MESSKIGLVLAGGGAKGVAHLGVMKAMREYGVDADIVSGTSAGALAAAFYASGFEPEEVMEIFLDPNIFKFKGFSWKKPGMLEPERYLSFVEKYFGNSSFEDLNKKLIVVATDLISGKIKVFNSGSLVKPLYATCAFPFVFSPVAIGDSLYSDGGIIDNFPVEQVTGSQRKVLGVYVSPLSNIQKENLKRTHHVLDRVYRISNRYSSLEKISECTWVVNPPELQNYGTFNLSKIQEIFDIGYKHGSKVMPEIAEQLNN